MSNPIDEIRQTPDRVVEKDVVVVNGRQRSLKMQKDFASSLGNAVREQPASATLITMGVAWLFMGGAKVPLFGKATGRQNAQAYRLPEGDPGYPSNRRFDEGQSAPSAHAAGESLRHGGSAAVEAAKQAGSAIGRDASAAGSAVGKGVSAAGSAVGDGASAAASGVSEAASRTYDGLDTATHAASDAVSNAGAAAYRASRSTSLAARREAEHLQQSLSEFFERQPWAIGALGLAVGAGAAAFFPKTRTEQEWMGETSEAAKDQARALVSEQLVSARRLAERAFEETAREARAQGLSEEKVADAVRAFSEKLTNVASTAGGSLITELDKATDAGTKS